MKKKWLKFSLFLSPFGILIVVSLLWVYLFKPKLIHFIQGQIPKLNSVQNWAHISLHDFDISFLKLQFSASEVQFQFKESLAEFEPLKIQSLRFQIDPFKLLVGQISISKIQIDRLDWAYQITQNKNEKKQTELPLEQFFNLLPQIPIDQLVILNSQLSVTSALHEIHSKINISQANLQNQKSGLSVAFKKIQIQNQTDKKNNIQGELNLEARLDQDKKKDSATLEISQFELKTLNSLFYLSGKFLNFKKVQIEPEGFFKIKSEIHFDDLRTIALSLFPQKNRLPAITGFLKAEGDVSFKSLKNINGHLTLETKQVNVDHFKLGQAQVKAEIKKNQLLINQIELEHPSGKASLKEIEIEQNSPFSFKAKMNVNQFDLQKMFVSMGLAQIPAGFMASGQSACSGQFEPEFKVSCQVESELQNIWVKTEPQSHFHILKLKTAALKGQIQANLQGLQYKTDLRLGQSVGLSQGQVLFKEGFKINFETEKLSFNDVESLADLNFKGDLKIKGSTSGDSNAGIIDAEAVFTNASIDRFKLGRLESKLKYEKGLLDFKQLNGLIGRSTYQGDVHFDFNKSTLASHLELQKLMGEDLISALNERFYIPFTLSGQGQAQIDVKGPFDFWKLSYDLKAQLNQGQIADEGFDALRFNLTATGDKIHLDQVYLKKRKSLITFEGDLLTQNKEPQYAVQIKAQPLLLEESDHLMKIAPQLTGQAWVEGYIKNELLNPHLFFNFNIKQMNFENADYPGSQGQITIDKNNFKFQGQLFGRQIQSDLIWPWSEKDPYSLRLQIRDLNPLILLPLISLPQPSNEFYSRLNADVDLKSDQRNMKNSEGSIRINDFMLQRGALYLKLAKSANLFFKNGLSQMDPIDFKGESNSLKVNLISSKKEEVRLTVAGDLQLKQFQFLVPFAQSLAGRFQIDSQILFRGNEFELFGDGEITDGLVNLKGFPQAIENINTPIEFSKSKIRLSDITAQLGPSEISGQGQIDIKGHHQINVNLQASAENIELTFPDQITTAGKAEMLFFGNWLPYTLKVNYKVARGLVEKDFGQESNQNKASLKASPYLPPQQIELQAPSLLLDVAVDLTQGVVVKNKIIEGEAFGKLQVNGTPENPKILGRIDIKTGSKLIFKDKAFDIQTATIQFPPGPEINPDIYMTASSRVSDYDINLLVQGPSKNLSIKPSSQPPLSEPDIFSLLALGLTSSKLDQNLSSDTQTQQTGLEIIASQVNQSQVNKKFQEKFGLTVQLTPTVDSTKNIAVPKVVVSKKIQKNLNASYSRPLTGDTQNQEWKLQYLFNPNKSMILNYQNTETNQQNQLGNTNTTDQGVLGLDFEYKKEFK